MIRALTVCQPYATLIALPDDDPRAKRVENRSRRTSYRGTLYVHAGLSRKWLVNPGGIPCEEDYGLTIADMHFGAVVAVAELVGCARIIRGDGHERPPGFAPIRSRESGTDWVDRESLARWPWLAGNEHAWGRWCWILEDVRPLHDPVPCRGMQGLWLPPEKVVAEVSRQLEMMEAIR